MGKLRARGHVIQSKNYKKTVVCVERRVKKNHFLRGQNRKVCHVSKVSVGGRGRKRIRHLEKRVK